MFIAHATIIGCVRIPCVGHGDVAIIARFVMRFPCWNHQLLIMSEFSVVDHLKISICRSCRTHWLLWGRVGSCALVHKHPWKSWHQTSSRIDPWMSYSYSACSACHVTSIHWPVPKCFLVWVVLHVIVAFCSWWCQNYREIGHVT